MSVKDKFRRLWVGFAAELLATCFFVFNVVGATLMNPSWPAPNVLHIAITAGLSTTVLATAIGHLTGGQINPVVSLSFTLTQRIHPIDGLVFVFAQLLGGILGASILYGLIPSALRGSFGVTMPFSKLDVGQALGTETLLTFLLVFTIHSVTDSSRPASGHMAPVIIGVCVFICHMVGIPLSGCSMNPARSLGPALITNTWTHHWVYWVGPVLGAVPAGFCYEFVFSAKKNSRVLPNESLSRPENADL